MGERDPQLRPQKIMSDFELATLAAMWANFPNSNMKGYVLFPPHPSDMGTGARIGTVTGIQYQPDDPESIIRMHAHGTGVFASEYGAFEFRRYSNLNPSTGIRSPPGPVGTGPGGLRIPVDYYADTWLNGRIR